MTPDQRKILDQEKEARKKSFYCKVIYIMGIILMAIISLLVVIDLIKNK